MSENFLTKTLLTRKYSDLVYGNPLEVIPHDLNCSI